MIFNDEHLVNFIRDVLIPEIWYTDKLTWRKLYGDYYLNWFKENSTEGDQPMTTADFFTRMNALFRVNEEERRVRI